MARTSNTKSFHSSMAPNTIQNGYRYDNDNTDDESVIEAPVERLEIAKQLSFTSSQNTSNSSLPPPPPTVITVTHQPTDQHVRTLLPFSIQKYDNVLHHWENKPFVKDTIRTFFGSVRQDKMEQKVSDRRKSICACDPTAWDPEGLVLTDVSRPFQSKLLFSVSHCDQLWDKQKIKYVSGTWLSRVYCGDYQSSFLDWIDDLTDYCKKTYGKVIRAPRDFYVYYPSETELQPLFQGDSLVVFFVKLED